VLTSRNRNTYLGISKCLAILAAFTLSGIFAFAGPLSASESRVADGDTIRVPSGPLEVASLAFAHALSDRSGEEMARVFAADGIRLHLDASGHAGLSSRQAVATIREFLRGYDSGKAVVTRAAPVEGSPNRGFAEVVWVATVARTSHEVRRTLFVGLRRDGEVWRVDEVRFLR
jgi:hypothetical protein